MMFVSRTYEEEYRNIQFSNERLSSRDQYSFIFWFKYIIFSMKTHGIFHTAVPHDNSVNYMITGYLDWGKLEKSAEIGSFTIFCKCNLLLLSYRHEFHQPTFSKTVSNNRDIMILSNLRLLMIFIADQIELL